MTKQTKFNGILALLMIVVLAVYSLTSSEQWSVGEITVSFGLFALLMFAYAGMADEAVIHRLRDWVAQQSLRAFIPPAVLLAISWAYFGFAQQLTAQAMLTTGIYLFVPVLLLWWDRDKPQRFTWRNALALLILWWMIEWKLLPNVGCSSLGWWHSML